MKDITTAHLSGPGTGYVEIVAADEPTVRQIAELLSGTWTSSGPPAVRSAGQVPGQAAFTGRVYLDTSLPAPGRTRVLPADWVRFPLPPWGGRVDGVKPTCLRRKKDHRACGRQAAEWPRGYGADDPGACWSHLTEEEQQECRRVRQAYRAAFWALKRRHQEEAGHGRDERCDGCTWPYEQRPPVVF
ncbi:DUF6207 family protein [Streptomyces sp. NBC_01221]|uniref:DUF6207 family protein n=1 Tax=Streptomyces sp. NBC_01221 TaxID=2903782 RepID=UPI0022527EC2|nr:DUF6207 family protein [Streptomyces sp. NBC_01221]MCX4791887.1 DUF6207 family protein [Streptomyces sp. NBC_01221]